jgi:hypothetical protein
MPTDKSKSGKSGGMTKSSKTAAKISDSFTLTWFEETGEVATSMNTPKPSSRLYLTKKPTQKPTAAKISDSFTLTWFEETGDVATSMNTPKPSSRLYLTKEPTQKPTRKPYLTKKKSPMPTKMTYTINQSGGSFQWINDDFDT